ncbi:MAG: hypothetical protein JWS12_982 [Candidatus Saccharibacteria bacterium]|nr:hypothetical protein [Candidatus Saccharibacteria bacterium]
MQGSQLLFLGTKCFNFQGAMRKNVVLSHYPRGVAQLVARTAGGREVAGSSPVTPTIDFLTNLRHCYSIFVELCSKVVI